MSLTAAVDRWIERTFFADVTYLRPARSPSPPDPDSRWPGCSPRGGRSSGPNHSP